MFAPFAGVPGPLALSAVALAYAWLAVASVVLTVIDVRTHRLPNRWVLPGYPIVAGLLLVACLGGAPWGSLMRAAIGGAVLFLFYLALRAAGGGMGGGDVKLAGVLGAALGWAGWSALAVGAFAGFLFGGVYGAALLAARQAHRRTAVAFGPWMLLGAWTGILFGAQVTARLGL